jgi:small subunit ribosomal protein S17
MSTERNNRKVKEGVVLSNKMSKTVVVKVIMSYPHPLYRKIITKTKKYYAHDEDAHTLNEGDKVKIAECRPYSKLKRWHVVKETK